MSKPPSKRRRVELTLQDKINESESFPKPSQKSLSEKFGVGKTTVSDILKRKSEYLERRCQITVLFLIHCNHVYNSFNV
jgi:hypothetical protein